MNELEAWRASRPDPAIIPDSIFPWPRRHKEPRKRLDYREIVRLEKEIYGEPITETDYRGGRLDDPAGGNFVLPLYLPHMTIVPRDPIYGR